MNRKLSNPYANKITMMLDSKVSAQVGCLARSHAQTEDSCQQGACVLQMTSTNLINRMQISKNMTLLCSNCNSIQMKGKLDMTVKEAKEI